MVNSASQKALLLMGTLHLPTLDSLEPMSDDASEVGERILDHCFHWIEYI